MDELLSPEKITSIKDDFPFILWVKEGAKAQLEKCHRDRPDMTKEEASEIIKGAFGSRPDLPSGKDFVDEVRGHDRPDREDTIRTIIGDARLTAYQDGRAGIVPFRIGSMDFEKQISALFPDIEQIRKDYDELILEMRREFDAKITLAKEIVREQAVREEQERIDNIITKLADENPECPVNLFLKDDIVRQALKEGEK